MIRLLLRIAELTGGRRDVTRYLLACALYAAGEGAAFGLLVPLLTDLLDGRTAAAAWWLLPLAGCVAVCWTAHFAQQLRALGLSSAWRRALSDAVGRHVLRLPLGWFDDTRTGQLERLLGRGIGTVAGAPHLAQALAGAVLTPVVVFGFLLGFDWRMALAGLVTVPVVLLVFAAARRLTDRTEAQQDAAAAEASGRLVEFAGAQPVLRAGGRAAHGRRLLDDALVAQDVATRRAVLGALPGRHLGALAIQLAFTAVLAAGLLIAAGDADPGRVLALIVLGMRLLEPFATLAGAAGGVRATRAAFDRIAALLATEPLPEPASPAVPADASVTLHGVDFAYTDGEPVLSGVDIEAPAGRTTALVGRSGAGKSTVTKLVARFFDVTGGAVRIGGVDVRELGSAGLRRWVTVVSQDVYLLDGTIEDNIRFGAPDADRARVREAARRARVDEIAGRLPDGWASRVGAGGTLLSGGERQRVAIARALLTDAPVVLLDEATSALDAGNEAAIRAAIAELGRDRTILVVAHRLSTIADADSIVVLDGGRVAETGTHDQLLGAGGSYAALWQERDRARGWRLTGA